MNKASENEVHPVVLELRDLRKAAGMTQQEVGAELGYESGSTISGYERGSQSPRLDDLDAWAALHERQVSLTSTAPQPKAAPAKGQAPADTVAVPLTPYQIALVNSELTNRADSLHNSGRSSRMVKDLDAIVDVLTKALGR